VSVESRMLNVLSVTVSIRLFTIVNLCGVARLITRLTHLSKSQEVDLVLSIFFSHFYFIFDLFPIILFLELELGLE